MVRRVLSDVLDTKIVDHKGETCVFGGMLPKGRGPSNRGVTKLCMVYLEPIVRDVAVLFQAWHAFADLQVYPSVRCKLEEVVLGDDFLREYCQADFHILVTPHGGVVIKILNVKSDETGTRGGDCALQYVFGLLWDGSVSGGITREVQPVAANGDADAMCFCLVGPDTGNELQVGDCASDRDC